MRVQERGFLLLPVAQSGGELDGSHVDRMLADVDVAGVVAQATEANERAGEKLRSLGVPVVWMSLGKPERTPPGLAHVCTDEEPGIEAALERLVLGDNQEVLVIVGPRSTPERTEIASRFFPDRVRVLSADSWLPLDGYDVARRALQEGSNIGAIVCGSDLLAIGATQACSEAGLPVPDAVSVIGFGGFEPPRPEAGLTTVRWPLRELVVAAFDVLIDRLSDPRDTQVLAPAPTVERIPSELIRGSTARLAQSPLRNDPGS